MGWLLFRDMPKIPLIVFNFMAVGQVASLAYEVNMISTLLSIGMFIVPDKMNTGKESACRREITTLIPLTVFFFVLPLITWVLFVPFSEARDPSVVAVSALDFYWKSLKGNCASNVNGYGCDRLQPDYNWTAANSYGSDSVIGLWLKTFL